MPRPPFTRRYIPPARPAPADVLHHLRVMGADPARMDALAGRWGQGAAQKEGHDADTGSVHRGDGGRRVGGPADGKPDGGGRETGTGAGRVGNRNRARGDAAEARCRRDLRAAGWHINSGRTGSFGAADIIAHRTERVAPADRPGVDTLMVQVKRLREFRAAMLNAADADFARLPRLAASHRLEMWAWVDYQGWVAVVIHHQDGRLSGSGSHVKEVIQSLTKSRLKRAHADTEPPKRTTTKQQRPPSFMERLRT